MATDAQKEILIRADRLFMLGKRTGTWEMTRTNDPRFHVGWNQLKKGLDFVDREGRSAPDDQDSQRLHVRKIRSLLESEGDHPKMVITGEHVLSIVRDNERVVVFCDHHETALELAMYLGRRLREELPMLKTTDLPWVEAYTEACKFESVGRSQARALAGFLSWLSSAGIASQVSSWLPEGIKTIEQLTTALTQLAPLRAGSRLRATSIADEARYLWNHIRKSSSSRQLFAVNSGGVAGADLDAHRIVAATRPSAGSSIATRAIFAPGAADTVVSLFNSPFGPDVLVVTDAFSEGFDLHRYCRYMIHYELDPSPMRTIQRNGRLRRVDCWAARTDKPLMISYPVFLGTRDERMVETMMGRLAQFDLLLGGVGSDIQSDAGDAESRRLQEQVLEKVRRKLTRSTRILCV